MILTKSVRVNEFGVREFPPSLEESIIGRTVTIRDWYGDITGEILGVALSLSGYPATVEMSAANGKHVPAFSLHSTREIEVHEAGA